MKSQLFFSGKIWPQCALQFSFARCMRLVVDIAGTLLNVPATSSLNYITPQSLSTKSLQTKA